MKADSWTMKELLAEGGTAFPHTAPDRIFQGMTLRDYFAARAMQSLVHDLAEALACGDEKIELALKNTARLSYAIADSMIRERNRD